MTDSRTCLWTGVGVAVLIMVCCVGVALGSMIAKLGMDGDLGHRDGDSLPVFEEVVSEQAGEVQEQATKQAEQTAPPKQAPEPLPTATPFPTPRPPSASPPSPPDGSDLRALVSYANEMKPLLDEAGRLLKRDGRILEASEDGNDAVLCDGRLASDNRSMTKLLRRARKVSAPADAVAIHDLVLRSGDAWTQSLDYIGMFCETGNELHKLPAVLKFWEAAATLQDAANRFWLLLIAEGAEDWVKR